MRFLASFGPGAAAVFVTGIRPAYSPALAWPGLTALPAPAHPVGRNVERPGSGIVRSPGRTRGTSGRHRCLGIRTGRLNCFSLGIICVRDRTMGNKSSFRRKKAGRALGVASNC